MTGKGKISPIGASFGRIRGKKSAIFTFCEEKEGKKGKAPQSPPNEKGCGGKPTTFFTRNSRKKKEKKRKRGGGAGSRPKYAKGGGTCLRGEARVVCQKREEKRGDARLVCLESRKEEKERNRQDGRTPRGTLFSISSLPKKRRKRKRRKVSL